MSQECKPPSIRILPELRAAMVEFSREMTPAHTIYFGVKYDLEGTNIPKDMTCVSLIEAVKFLWASDATVLELPEPLWMRELPRSVCLAVAWKLSRRKPSNWSEKRIVSFAIENNDLISLVSPKSSKRRLLVAIARRRPGRSVVCIRPCCSFSGLASVKLG